MLESKEDFPWAKRTALGMILSEHDDLFEQIAIENNFDFTRPLADLHYRALRKGNGMKLGVFFDLKLHWMKSDEKDPEVTILCAAFHTPDINECCVYEFKEFLFCGQHSTLDNFTMRRLLKEGCRKLVALSTDFVLMNGQCHRMADGKYTSR